RRWQTRRAPGRSPRHAVVTARVPSPIAGLLAARRRSGCSYRGKRARSCATPVCFVTGKAEIIRQGPAETAQCLDCRITAAVACHAEAVPVGDLDLDLVALA